MLKIEEARAQLEKLENKEWVAGRLGAIDSLPELLRDTARTLVGPDEEPLLRLQGKKSNRNQELLKGFKAMDEQGRLQFFETLAPGLGTVIERGWQMHERLPYQGGYDRKPFRAPGHPDALIMHRIRWLAELLRAVGPYQKNIAWFAAWAPFLAHGRLADSLGILFAAAIDGGGSEGEEVFQILCASGRNEHEIGGMGRHVTRGLLDASRPDGWQFIENMLLAAQREEGLRQVILETVDEAHPQAFRRMLRLIIDQNLARFSATVRAFDVWLG